jgi:hypothetical protein
MNSIVSTMAEIQKFNDSTQWIDMRTVDYARLGSDIEYKYNQEQRNTFWRKHWMSTDSAMASLACFCRFLHTAGCERAAGREDVAQLSENNAYCVFERSILPENRW